MNRIVEPEWLDELPPDDPDAVRSRRDLCRVNAWMRHHTILASALRQALNGRVPNQIVELGAGDGNFLLQVARRLALSGGPPLASAKPPAQPGSGGQDGSHSPGPVAEIERERGQPCPRDANTLVGIQNISKSEHADSAVRAPSLWVTDPPGRPAKGGTGHQTAAVNVTLLDRHNIVQPRTLAAFAALGWQAEAVSVDVVVWSQSGIPADIVVANLFLHHFTDMSLAGLLRAIAARTRLFIAIEPRRSALSWLGSRLLWVIRCNQVTQHDAGLSVRAGFAGDELSRLWPRNDGWQLTEQRAGLFSHLFIAQKTCRQNE
jgi:hypothetical protein